jgi:hypothetical protein
VFDIKSFFSEQTFSVKLNLLSRASFPRFHYRRASGIFVGDIDLKCRAPPQVNSSLISLKAGRVLIQKSI